MPPRAKSQEESKQGLIITLVFFILATLGLGVATYFGFAEQDKLEKAAKDAKNAENTFKAERDWYKFQAQMLYSYAGLAEGMDDVDTLGTRKGQFDSGSMKGGKDKEFATKALQSLEKPPMNLGWNGNQPKETLQGTIAKLNTEVDNLRKEKQDLKLALDKARRDMDAKDEELQAARKDYETKLVELKKTFQNDFTKSNQDLTDFRTQVDNLSAKLKSVREEGNKEKKTLNRQIGTLKGEINFQNKRIKDQKSRIESFEAKSEKAPANMRTDWKIIKMDVRGLNPYINLGSADHVKPQLTFTVHGVGVDGQPNTWPKGTLEVVHVVGPHVSQARVTSVKDRNRDPIIAGDVIYNGSWNPNLKKHVAIAGIIDLGDRRDRLFEFMRNLERQNIVVDAYLNPKDGAVKGKITFQTDYLIQAPLPETKDAAKMSEAEKQMVLDWKLMQEEAKKYGVQIKSLSAYLEMIGYRLPRSVDEERPSLYNPALRPDLAPRLGGAQPPRMRPYK